MVQSIFEVFKISLGPSSSHTTGPMLAARDFIQNLWGEGLLDQVASLQIQLFGSLAATGIGHGTDKALILGLMGFCPDTIDPFKISALIEEQKSSKKIKLLQNQEISFNQNKDLIFKHGISHPFHPNAFFIQAKNKHQKELSNDIYYSIGGGKILSEKTKESPPKLFQKDVPFVFTTSSELLNLCSKNKLLIHELVLKNEESLVPKEEVLQRIDHIIKTMEDCIEKGCREKGILPGHLKVKRRAHKVWKKLTHEDTLYDPISILDWINLYALAVNEENASGSKIVTAPTNGAAGIIPAVLNYYKKHIKDSTKEGCYNFLLTAGAVGTLYMNKASISGAEVGCQGEVGVACSMAAAGLTAARGGSNIQIEKAAEIAMEHNLGLTCDPIGGLVQIPCIERNAIASTKAINASRLARMNDEPSYVSLDDVIRTMYQTGLDMKESYKETSSGGLAVNLTNC